jgi:putative membrane protein
MPDEKKGLDRAQQYLANERTFLSWLRTSIALVGLGFIIARFGLFLREFNLLMDIDGSSISQLPEYSFSPFLGLSMVGLGVAFILYALKNYVETNRDIENGLYVPKNKIIYASGIVLAIFGVVMVIYLLVVSVT